MCALAKGKQCLRASLVLMMHAHVHRGMPLALLTNPDQLLHTHLPACSPARPPQFMGAGTACTPSCLPVHPPACPLARLRAPASARRTLLVCLPACPPAAVYGRRHCLHSRPPTRPPAQVPAHVPQLMRGPLLGSGPPAATACPPALPARPSLRMQALLARLPACLPAWLPPACC